MKFAKYLKIKQTEKDKAKKKELSAFVKDLEFKSIDELYPASAQYTREIKDKFPKVPQVNQCLHNVDLYKKQVTVAKRLVSVDWELWANNVEQKGYVIDTCL